MFPVCQNFFMWAVNDIGQFIRKINIDTRKNVELYNETFFIDFAD